MEHIYSPDCEDSEKFPLELRQCLGEQPDSLFSQNDLEDKEKLNAITKLYNLVKSEDKTAVWRKYIKTVAGSVTKTGRGNDDVKKKIYDMLSTSIQLESQAQETVVEETIEEPKPLRPKTKIRIEKPKEEPEVKIPEITLEIEEEIPETSTTTMEIEGESEPSKTLTPRSNKRRKIARLVGDEDEITDPELYYRSGFTDNISDSRDTSTSIPRKTKTNALSIFQDIISDATGKTTPYEQPKRVQLPVEKPKPTSKALSSFLDIIAEAKKMQ